MSKALLIPLIFLALVDPAATGCGLDHASSGEPVIIAAPAIAGGGLSLDVQVKHQSAELSENPVSGVVQLRSVDGGESISVGTFSVFAPGGSDDVRQYRFDLSSQAKLLALGASFQVEVVAVDPLTGQPAAENPYEVLGAQFTTVN